jgi:polyhydroxybutyrate depolymerase
VLRTLLLASLFACSSSQTTPETIIDASTTDTTVVTGDGPAAVTCSGRTSQPLDATWTVKVGSAMRTAEVHVPASYDPSKPTPVVIDLHGRVSNGSQEASLNNSIAKSDSAGFIVVHPESMTSPTSWNAGTCCDPANTNNVDDVGFINALLDQLEAQLCVDTHRVFAMGMSNGAYFSHTLACEMGDRIAAIGPVAGLLLMTTCNPARPMPNIMVNGTADSLSLYQYVPQTVKFWTDFNKCTTTQTTYQQGSATCVTHGGCDGGADVVLCTINNGGHQWPGGQTLPFLGNNTNDLIATDALWSFFMAHPH